MVVYGESEGWCVYELVCMKDIDVDIVLLSGIVAAFPTSFVQPCIVDQ